MKYTVECSFQHIIISSLPLTDSHRERERERERERYLLLQLSVTNVPCVFVSKKKKKIMGL